MFSNIGSLSHKMFDKMVENEQLEVESINVEINRSSNPTKFWGGLIGMSYNYTSENNQYSRTYLINFFRWLLEIKINQKAT